ncbi:D-2-hydroxyacid dehydrogenase [Virgibacillus siamensis]|uniref:D-2-hydroxyacid dehydrogenase n=1 Tax=Virgibacillus siamensis TaxID=480071 RepID=UPI000984977F|nr:D-2-hydroxyacid dehydrogenase [Virgibacillus siamensis]
MVILSSAKLSDKHKDRLKDKYPEMTFIFCNNMDEAEQHLSKAEVLITYGEDLTADLVEQASKLKWIMVISAGLEKMPLTKIEEKGILVTNAKGIHKYQMAEYAISMLLQVYRQNKVMIENEAANRWNKSVRLQEITGKSILIAGTGAVGGEVARLAKAFRMKTYGVSRSGRPVEYIDKNYSNDQLKDVLPKADIVVSVLPSTTETKHFFTYEYFQMLPDHAVFLNMGRGDAVSQDVILQAIQDGEIAHAVLDVFETEPLPEDHPFWEETNITITPHISGRSPMYHTRALEIFEQNLQAYLDHSDDYVNKIDVTRGY